MRVFVTGATGFVGRHVVASLLARGHTIVAIARSVNRAQEMPWFNRVEFIQCDLHEDFQCLLQPDKLPDAIVHLAWPGLPNYRDFFHISRNLPADLTFLEAAVSAGIPHLLVAGTCLEYGMQYGPLAEDLATNPTTPYGIAKDVLRKALQILRTRKPFTLQWLRLFYMYGEGQSKNSLLAQLDCAIDEGRPIFHMSIGDQLRDYLPIEDVGKRFSMVLENPHCQGVINCCSGEPISVIDLVSRRCMSKGSNIQLNRGYYSYPDYEPMAFWGVPSKLANLARQLPQNCE